MPNGEPHGINRADRDDQIGPWDPASDSRQWVRCWVGALVCHRYSPSSRFASGNRPWLM